MATYLGASYANGVRVHGLVLLHPISDNRMAGSTLRNIQLVKAVCGLASYENLAIATTMWPEEATYPEMRSLEARESEMSTIDKYFGDLVAKGATMFRYSQTGHGNPSKRLISAQDIISHLVARLEIHAPEVLRLQRELIEEKKLLDETAAGKAVTEDLEKSHAKYKRELRELKANMKCRLAGVTDTYASHLREQKTDIDKRLKEVEHNRRVLKKSMQDLHKDEGRSLKQLVENTDASLRTQISGEEKKLMDMEEFLHERKEEFREEKTRTSQETPRRKKIQPQLGKRQRQVEQPGRRTSHEHQPAGSKAGEREDTERLINDMKTEIAELRKGLIRKRETHKAFRGQTSTVWDGTMNGVAAGVASGVIGVGKRFNPRFHNIEKMDANVEFGGEQQYRQVPV
ncbi:hypothetical protein ACJ41O_010982 [Fusarium nematophilum]